MMFQNVGVKIKTFALVNFCGKMYGKAAVKVESLQRFLRSGTITPEEYNQRIEAIKNE